MFQRLADLYVIQARRALEVGCGGRKVYDTPVDLEPCFAVESTHKGWFSSITQHLAFPVKKPSASTQETQPAADRCFLHLRISKEDDTTPAAAEQLLVGLRTTDQPVAFEIVGNGEQTILQMVCSVTDQPKLEGLLSVRYPHSQVIRTTEDALQQALERNNFVLAEYDLVRSHAYMLSTCTSFKGVDPLAIALGALEELPDEGFGALQILFGQVDNAWRDLLRRATVDLYDNSASSQPDQEQLIAWADKKASAPFFAVIIRLMGSHGSLIQRLEGFLELFNSPENRLVRVSGNSPYPPKYQKQVVLERLSYRHGLLLNATELAGIVHLPSTSVNAEKLLRSGTKTASLPPPFRERRAGVCLGTNIHRGRQWKARLTEEELTRHLYCCGVSGTGKSTFLLNLLLQLIDAGYGVAVLDPHGDLVEQQILPRIPAHRREEVIWFDPGDDAYPIAFNILAAESEDERELLTEDLVSIFQRMTTGWGPRLETLLAYATLAIVGSQQGGMLNDLRRFLTDDGVRAHFLTDHPDEDVRYFWEQEFPSFPKGAISPVQTRLNTFLRRRRIRNIVGQKHNRLPFRHIMDEGKILLCKLSHGAVGETNSYLLGSLLCSRIQQTAMMRQNIPEEKRRTFILAIDEFHNFICRSMESILSGARKYRLGLCLAHQEMQQLWGRDKEVAASVLANPYTRLCFRVGDYDAKQLVEGFEGFSVKDLQNLSRGQALIRLDRSDHSCNLETLPPPPLPPDGEQVAREIIERSRQTYGTPAQELERESQTPDPSSQTTSAPEDDFYA